MDKKPYSYLALGDSYTIGEDQPVRNSFPYQTVQLLRKEHIACYAPEIVAATGWTSDELLDGMENTRLLEEYDIVSLLIGVNNQYREKSIEAFSTDFENLIKRAIALTGHDNKKVFVLSIPDWGVTPFAEGKVRENISASIDSFNYCCGSMSQLYGVEFINITQGQRHDVNDPRYLAPDQLHPSGEEYAKWAAKLAAAILRKKE